VQKNQPELPGNHLPNHLRAVADQVDPAADQGDQAADDHKVEPVELVVDLDLARDSVNQTKSVFNLSILPLSFSYRNNEGF